MSWSLGMDIEDRATAVEVIEKQAEEYFAGLSSDSMQEMAEQCAKAAECVDALIGVIGTDGPWRVMMNGHANPGHGQREGWANDSVSVTITEDKR